MPLTLPFVPGRRLVDLINELERRLAGQAPGAGLAADLADAVPDASSYVFVLFDGLGTHQLDHGAARSLRASARGVLAAPFPTTTTVSLATISTGRMPAEHGMIGHLMLLDGAVVNVLKWVTPAGAPFDHPTEAFLPGPNTWERLRAAGVEPITVQPAEFAHSPLTRAIYRGCRFEGVHGVEEAVEATAVLAREPGRLVFTYFNQVDFAAHVWGQTSAEYRTAIGLVDTAWAQLRARLKPGVVMVGSADHGHLDYGPGDKLLVRDPEYSELTFYGDARMVFVRGDTGLIGDLGASLGVSPHWVSDGDGLWPGDRHAALGSRLPTAVLAAPEGKVILPKGFDKRLVGYHGGLAYQEVEVPLLVG
jgi:hypothetical protein